MGDRKELLSTEGLRLDGRRPKELRRLSARTGVLPRADGSAYVQMGNTRCLCTVYGPKERERGRGAQASASSSSDGRPPPSGAAVAGMVTADENEDGASASNVPQVGGGAQIRVDFHVPTFAQTSGQRGSGGRSNRGSDRRTVELAATLGRTMEPVIIASGFPRSEIRISCQMIQMDGGALACAINAATLAVMDAGIPVTDYVCAVTAGVVRLPKGYGGAAGSVQATSDPRANFLSSHEVLLDLNSLEENSPQAPSVTLSTLAKRNQSRVVSLISEHKFHLESLQSLLETAADGCAGVQKVLEAEIKRTLEARLAGGSHSIEEVDSGSAVLIDLNASRGSAKAS